MQVKLSELAEISLGFPVQGSIEANPDGNVRIVRPANGNDRLSIDWEGVVRTSLPEHKKRRPLQNGDLLFNLIGKDHPAYFVESLPADLPAVAHQHFSLIRTDHRLDPRFLWLLLNLDSTQEYFRENASGRVKKVVNQKILGGFLVPLLPVEEQRRWRDRWLLARSKIDRWEAERERLQLHIQEENEAFSEALEEAVRS